MNVTLWITTQISTKPKWNIPMGKYRKLPSLRLRAEALFRLLQIHRNASIKELILSWNYSDERVGKIRWKGERERFKQRRTIMLVNRWQAKGEHLALEWRVNSHPSSARRKVHHERNKSCMTLPNVANFYPHLRFHALCGWAQPDYRAVCRGFIGRKKPFSPVRRKVLIKNPTWVIQWAQLNISITKRQTWMGVERNFADV